MTVPELFAKGLIQQRDLKIRLHTANTALAQQNDEIMAQRLEARSALQKALAAFDQETRQLQLKADEEKGFQDTVDELNKELKAVNKDLGEVLETMQELDPFTFTDQAAGIIIVKSTEKRSGGTTLKAITQALTKAGAFKTTSEAEQTIKAHNMVDTPVLKIKDLQSGATLDIDKELPKPQKRQRKQ